ncbi:hypothetical protein GGI07_003264 [Coemansia sp. Benny D115]|nr:hypothetical protein GGI07_003264 [Coemansia sp. Benny D115]
MTEKFTPIEGATEAQNKLLQDVHDKFTISDQHLYDISCEVYKYLSNGLSTDDTDANQQSLPCRVSYVKSGITHDIREAEKAQSLALGMTINTATQRIKIASVKFLQGAPPLINKQIFLLPNGIKSPAQLFEEASVHVADFINSHELDPAGTTAKPLYLGVSVDLALEETSKMGGRVVGDSRDCLGMFGNLDIAHGLNNAFVRKHLPVRVNSTTNCVISTLVAAQRHFPHTCAALILNHGINASYYERASNISKISGSELGNSEALVAINTELARFGENSDVLSPTMWDHRIDRESTHTGRHVFEKLVADRYLGEIVRNLITDFMDARLIFAKDVDVSMFSKPYSFFTSYMTIMEDSSEDLKDVGDLLCAGFNVHASVVDRRIVRALCIVVAMRAARLVGAAVAAVVRRAVEAKDAPAPATVAISGQLTEMNQPYVKCTTETARALLTKLGLGEAVTFNVLGEDGYTVGAALTTFSK